MTESSKPRRKRSQSIVATGLMATAAVSLGACDTTPPAPNWEGSAGREVDVATYSSLGECTSAGVFSADECNTAYLDANADNEEKGPRFADNDSCEAKYGVGQCVPRSSGGGGFMPLIAGFMIGQALSGGGGYGYRGAPLYREEEQYAGGGGGYGGGYVTLSGQRIERDYYTGRTKASVDTFQTPVRAQSRSAVVSRRGFGGGGRSYGG